MSIKRISDQKTRVSPSIGFILFLLALILFLLTTPIGLLYSIIYRLEWKSWKALGEYLLEVAISIDQSGNVIMQDLLNGLFILRGGYKFGNRDETISSVIGKNKSANTLAPLGKLLATVLDGIDSGHSLNSIDYYIEPRSDLYK
jgi:hypothetical protein